MLKLKLGKKSDAARQHKGLHVSYSNERLSSLILILKLKVMWEYLSTCSKTTDANVSFVSELKSIETDIHRRPILEETNSHIELILQII